MDVLLQVQIRPETSRASTKRVGKYIYVLTKLYSAGDRP